MTSWEERKRAVNHSFSITGKDGELRMAETTDRLLVKVTVADNKGKEMSCFLNARQFEALFDNRYELKVMTPEEAVVEKMADGAVPKDTMEAEDA